MNSNAQIIFLERSEIDTRKWNEALDNSTTPLVYAGAEWLDAMSPDWCALVYGAYNCVMPLPARKKFGIKYLAQPAFTQQLGVFFKQHPCCGLLNKFFERAQKYFRFAEIAVHNDLKYFDGETRILKNYELALNEKYETIASNFSGDFTRNLKRAEKFKLQYRFSDDIDMALSLYQNNYKETFSLNAHDLTAFRGLLKKMPAEKVLVRSVFNNDELVACALFVVHRNRIYNLASTTLPDGRKQSATHFLFANLIKEFSQRPVTLDFEGSNVVGVEQFYQQFGATLRPYYFVKWNRLPAVLKLFKK